MPVNDLRPEWFEEQFPRLIAGQDLDPHQLRVAFTELLSGRVEPIHVAAYLTALRMKGERSSEIAVAAQTLRSQMLKLVPKTRPVVDTCGTGGDDSGTFNISTAAGIVAAAAGVAVVKHGNRAVSSKSGSADVLRQLGIPIESGPEWAQDCLDRLNFAFCYAPQFHPAMANVASVRRQLGIRTIFNLLGPLANPANAEFQLLGVGKPALLETLAGAVAQLHMQRVVLVCSQDGLDEVGLDAPTMVRIVEGTQIRSEEWTAKTFQLEPCQMDALRADGPVESAKLITRILDGEPIPARRVVIANAATAIWVTGICSILEAVQRAELAITNGSAKRLLQDLTTTPR